MKVNGSLRNWFVQNMNAEQILMGGKPDVHKHFFERLLMSYNEGS